MASGGIAALVAVLALGVVEGMGRFYPSHRTWMRLRSLHGRRAVWAMRRRFEEAAERRTPRLLATVLLALCIGWIASAPLLDKRWYEVVMDVLPYAIVTAALVRIPASLRHSAARMKKYEDDAGDDPTKDIERGDGGPAAIAL
jgi:hypothetical protein